MSKIDRYHFLAIIDPIDEEIKLKNYPDFDNQNIKSSGDQSSFDNENIHLPSRRIFEMRFKRMVLNALKMSKYQKAPILPKISVN